jgi:hypothetical protein
MLLVGIRGQQFPSGLMMLRQEGLHQRNHLRIRQNLSNLLVRLLLQQELQ